ncbi:hypothetical protein [Elizabethkingia anophelis]|uniref:hypothetical protein n=1 Tax=Elizabethkingia anophelis TaxID=1117645 RepID=UPI000F7B2709|nr:hypothetical protein [Elizabethkingia anophelis]
MKTAVFFTFYTNKGGYKQFKVYLESKKKNNIILSAQNKEVVVNGELSKENKLYSELERENANFLDKLWSQFESLDGATIMKRINIFQESKIYQFVILKKINNFLKIR